MKTLLAMPKLRVLRGLQFLQTLRATQDLPVLRKLSSVTAMCFVPGAVSADLTITVDNFDKPEGTVYLSVFNSKESYDSGETDAAILAAQGKLKGATYSLTLHDLQPGNYAVRLFHDENRNGELDSNMLGIPKEGYGFSNNAGRMGPPSFEDAAVSVTDNTTASISLR